MKLLIKTILIFSLFLVVISYKISFPPDTFAAGCTLSVSPTAIAPHGSFSATVSNAQPGKEYNIVAYDNQTALRKIITVDSSGSFSFSFSVDEIFGASDPRTLSGSFWVSAGTTSAFEDAEACNPIAIVVTIDIALTPPPTVSIS